jgi:putative tricarboxylic transport membrane protein
MARCKAREIVRSEAYCTYAAARNGERNAANGHFSGACPNSSRQERTMKLLRPIIGLLLMSFSVQIIISSFTLGIGNFQSPGPGFMGFLASVLLLVLTAIIFIKDTLIKSGKEAPETALTWKTLRKPLVLTLALFGYIFFVETFGYLICTFLLMFVMLVISNPRKWYIQLINAFVIVNITYVVFYKMLRVLLPIGTLRLYW